MCKEHCGKKVESKDPIRVIMTAKGLAVAFNNVIVAHKSTDSRAINVSEVGRELAKSVLEECLMVLSAY